MEKGRSGLVSGIRSIPTPYATSQMKFTSPLVGATDMYSKINSRVNAGSFQRIGSSLQSISLPFWLVVALLVVVTIPLGMSLGRYNVPVWAAFVVWAEYFVLGAKSRALRLMMPSLAYGILITAAGVSLSLLLGSYIPETAALAVGLFLSVSFSIYSVRWSSTLREGSLAMFNGVSLLLAVYFSGSFPPAGIQMAGPWLAASWTMLTCVLGALLSWASAVLSNYGNGRK